MRARVSATLIKAKLKPHHPQAPTSLPSSPSSGQAPLFEGHVAVSGIKFNQVDLVKGVTGSLSLSGSRVSVNAQGGGVGGDQALDLSLSVPELSTILNLDPKPLTFDGQKASYLTHTTSSETKAVQEEDSDDGDSSFALKCGPMSLSAEVEKGGKVINGRAKSVTLDDFELGSLRGLVKEASFGAELDSNQGRMAMDVQGLKYENLMSEGFKTSVRWEGDTVKLEETVLVQKNSSYELQGELFVHHPPPSPLASEEVTASESIAASLSSRVGGLRPQDSPYRWQLRVSVPKADLQDLLPGEKQT